MLALLRSVIITLAAAAFAFVIGAYAGSAFGYLIAGVSGRDPAELKDILIWCMIGGTLVFSTGAIWLSVYLLKAVRWIKIVAGVLFCIATLGSASIVTLAYIEAPRYGKSRS